MLKVKRSDYGSNKLHLVILIAIFKSYLSSLQITFTQDELTLPLLQLTLLLQERKEICLT